MLPDLPAGAAARAHRCLDSLHSLIYFVPEAEEELTAVGLRPGRMCYFASRSAAMGPVSAGVTAATFYNFNPTLVARHIPRAWTLASTADILAARMTAVDRALRRLLGDDGIAGPDVAEAAELARAATAGLLPEGRALYAAHAELEWPGEPHLVLWQAVTLLREFRGDGHIAALLDADLSGLDALITHTATGRGFLADAAKATRGWSDEEWNAGADDLRSRGLLADDGLTAAGAATRDALERATDRLGSAGWHTLGERRLARLTELGRGLTQRLVGAGAFPSGVFAARK